MKNQRFEPSHREALSVFPRHAITLARIAITLAILVICGAVAPITASPAAAPSPSIAIQKRRIVIVRTGRFVRDFPTRRRAFIYYPVVMGPQDSVVLRKVRSILDLKNVFDTSVAEYKQDTWLSELNYEIGYNQNYILDITFTQSGVGAYPDTQTKHFAINLRTGELIKAGHAFSASSHEALVSLLDQKLQAEIKQIIKENPGEKENAESLFGELKYKAENLDDFAISSKGITFLYDAGFPHVAQALEPAGRYFISYSELQEFIKRDGPLGIFVRS